MDHWEIFPREAAAVGVKAHEQGAALLSFSRDALLDKARNTIQQAHEMTQFMMDRELIPPAPEDWS